MQQKFAKPAPSAADLSQRAAETTTPGNPPPCPLRTAAPPPSRPPGQSGLLKKPCLRHPRPAPPLQSEGHCAREPRPPRADSRGRFSAASSRFERAYAIELRLVVRAAPPFRPA